MENQVYSMFSKELEERIVDTVNNVIRVTAEQTNIKGSKRYFKKKDFCKEIGISFNTLTVWINKGLPVIQIEGISMLDMQDAIEFMNRHKI